MIGTIFTLYLLSNFATDKVLPHGEMIGFYCLMVFDVFTIMLLTAVSMAKQKSPIRRLLGNWLDVIGTSTFLSLAGDVGVVLIGVYLLSLIHISLPKGVLSMAYTETIIRKNTTTSR